MTSQTLIRVHMRDLASSVIRAYIVAEGYKLVDFKHSKRRLIIDPVCERCHWDFSSYDNNTPCILCPLDMEAFIHV